MHTPSPRPAPQSPESEDPVRQAVLTAASAPLREVFGERARVKLTQFNHIGPWAFVQGTMRGADGGRPDFSGTVYEKPAAAGQMSDLYVALLKESDSDPAEWRLLAHAIGPSDVAWETWPDDHAAPRELFGFRS